MYINYYTVRYRTKKWLTMRIPIFYRKSDSRQKLITLQVSFQSKKIVLS